MSKTRFECRQVILKKLTQMTPGSETLTYTFIFLVRKQLQMEEDRQ